MSKNQRAPFLVFCMVAVLCGFVMVATARGEASPVPIDARTFATRLIESAPLGGSRLRESDTPDASAQNGAASVLDATAGSDGSELTAADLPRTAITGGASSSEGASTSGPVSGPVSGTTSGGRSGPVAAGSSDGQETVAQGSAGPASGPAGGTAGAAVGGDGADGADGSDDPAEGPAPTDPASQPEAAPAAPWTPPVKGGSPAFGAPDGAGDGGPEDEGPSVGG
ncbi:hypothetical protein, partial [Nocardioides aquaticus]